jgi:hypothetical protein
MPTKKVTIKAKDTRAEIPSTATEAKVSTKKSKKTSTKEVHKICTIDNCKREYKAKGYCKFHYKEWRHGKFGMARYKTCKDNGGCRKPASLNKHGYCEEHFNNYYVKGMVAKAAPVEKKEEKVA